MYRPELIAEGVLRRSRAQWTLCPEIEHRAPTPRPGNPKRGFLHGPRLVTGDTAQFRWFLRVGLAERAKAISKFCARQVSQCEGVDRRRNGQKSNTEAGYRSNESAASMSAGAEDARDLVPWESPQGRMSFVRGVIAESVD